MVGSFLLKVFLFQAVVIAIIVFILKALLDKQLVESAVHKFETVNPSSFEPDLAQVIVITANGALNEQLKVRLDESLSKKFNRSINVVIQKDKRIKGGIIIKSQKLLIDNSLLSRLKEGGMIK